MTANQAHWAEPYRGMNPCLKAWKSALASRSYRTWWRNCKRGDWMLWAMTRSPEITQGSEEHVRLCWIVCRVWWELAYPWWYDYGQEHHDKRPQTAIAALEQWCLNHSDGAAEAAWAAWAAGAAGAAEAAGAARAAWAAGAAWAAEAAGAARAAEAAWAAGAARDASLERIAEIIREEMPEPPAIPSMKAA